MGRRFVCRLITGTAFSADIIRYYSVISTPRVHFMSCTIDSDAVRAAKPGFGVIRFIVVIFNGCLGFCVVSQLYLVVVWFSFASTCQVICSEDRLRNDLYCVK